MLLLFIAALIGTCVNGGFIPFKMDGRIVGGVDTAIEQLPYQVSIQARIGNYYYHTCGGTIINENTIISAGHCFHANDLSTYYIRVGSNYTNSGGMVIPTKAVFVHPMYDEYAIDYDVSILKLSKSITFSDSVAPIGGLADSDLQLPKGTDGIISGWGTTTWAGELAEVLQMATVPIVDQTLCRKLYSNFNDITDRMFCAGLVGEGGKDSCQGDSGGPFILNNTLVGIVSWGYKCADSNYPGVYSRISALRSWIDDHI